MTKKINKLIVILVGVLILGGLTFFGLKSVLAEQSGGSPESGVTSYIKTIYTSVVTLTQGSDAAGAWGDWGAYWNRISSTTALLPASMVNQVWFDGYGAPATETTNYSLTWTANPTPATGDDARAGRGGLDPRTGLTWSQSLQNNAGTVAFSPTGYTTWSWDGTTDADSIAVGYKTASLLCSDRGSGWRLPTQKELMQAYIDGSYWNLTQTSSGFWSATEFSSTFAFTVALYRGTTTPTGNTTGAQVRCVR